MKMYRAFIWMVPALLLGAGCATKKAQEDLAGSASAPVEAIQNQDLNFDSKGSDSGQIAGLKTVHFDFDKSTLTTEARRILADNAKWIKAQPTTTSVTVEGHTDERGSNEYNLALGERRAKAVQAYLVSLGVEARRLTTLSYGEERPLAQGQNEQAWSVNRRANFVPVQKVQNLNAQK